LADVSAAEVGKAPVERSSVKPEDVKELLVGNILGGTLPPKAARQTGARLLSEGFNAAISVKATSCFIFIRQQ
jgi:hypothetical protein